MDIARSRYVDLDGPVHVADLGGEGPPIVCVHGLGGSYANWAGAAPFLREFGHVTALDLPGFGLTPPAGRSATLEANRRLLHRYLTSLDGPSLLIGNSMGGAIALRQAARAPDTVDRLVLVSPAAPWRFHRVRRDPLILLLFIAYALPGLAGLMMLGRHRLPPRKVAKMVLGMLAAHPGQISPELVDLHVRLAYQRNHIPGIDRAFIRASRSVGFAAVRKQRYDRDVVAVTSPTLVVHGERDRLVPPEAALRLGAIRPDWQVRILEDVGHIAMLEVPSQFGEIVESFTRTPAVA